MLREAPLSEVEQAAGPAVAEGLRRLRAGQVRRKAGFDGQYGRVELFTQEELDGFRGQLSMLGAGELTQKRQTAPAPAPKPQRRQTKAEPEQEAQEMQPNEGQLAAACSAAACTAVVAGPGTGKTKTLTDRIVWLVRQCGVKPADITAVTFTNSAAEEMRTRLEKQLGGKRAVRGLTVGTFHAVCRAMLPDKPLLDEETALEFAAQTLEECGSGLRPAQLLDAVSRVKNGISFGDSQLDETVFTAYCARLRQAGVRDFDDLLADALEVEPPRPACFRHLLVDEFQDCNPLQYRLVCKWSALSESLFVIGDPDQSIYGFRGAEGRCFTRLKEDRPDTWEIRLTENYRSTPEILRFAGTVMEGDGGGNRTLSPVKPSGAPVRLVQAADPRAEGIFIAKEIGRMVGGVDMLSAGELRADREGLRSFSDIAVLCRTHRQARLIEQCLRHDGIPSVISGREDFLTDDGVRGALCFFRSLLNPSDSPALKTCLKLAFRCPPDLAERAAEQCGGMASLDLAPLRQAFGPGPCPHGLTGWRSFGPCREGQAPAAAETMAGRADTDARHGAADEHGGVSQQNGRLPGRAAAGKGGRPAPGLRKGLRLRRSVKSNLAFQYREAAWSAAARLRFYFLHGMESVLPHIVTMVAVPLVKPHHGQNLRPEDASHIRIGPQDLCGPFSGHQLFQLRPDPLRSNGSQQFPVPVDGHRCIRMDSDPSSAANRSPRRMRRASSPNRRSGSPTPQDLRRQVCPAAQRVVQGPLQVRRHRVDGEVPAPQILLQRVGERHGLRPPVVPIGTIPPECSDLHATLLRLYGDGAVAQTSWDSPAGKQGHSLLRPGGSGHIPVPRHPVQQGIPDAAAHAPCTIPRRLQCFQDLPYRSGDRYRCHVPTSLMSILLAYRGSALRAVPSPLHKKFRFPVSIHALLQDTEPLPPVEGCRPEVFPVDLQAQLPAAGLHVVQQLPTHAAGPGLPPDEDAGDVVSQKSDEA